MCGNCNRRVGDPPKTLSCGEIGGPAERIVGGEYAKKHSIPWQAGLVKKGSNFIFCGGTILDESHVLTAAHCVDEMKDQPNLFEVRSLG